MFEKNIKNLSNNYTFKDKTEINNICKKFNQYFNFNYRKFTEEIIVMDEQLFRDFKRSDPKRYINLRKVPNAFGSTKYSLGHFTKTYYIFKSNDQGPYIDGPFNNIEMDKMINDKKINSKSIIGINKVESFKLIEFINTTFPLPSKKNSVQTEEVKYKRNFNNDTDSIKKNFNKNKNEIYRKKKGSQMISLTIKNKDGLSYEGIEHTNSILTNDMSIKEKFKNHSRSRSRSRNKSKNKIKSVKNFPIDNKIKNDDQDSNDFFHINEVPIEDEYSRNVTKEQAMNLENQKLLNREINDGWEADFEIT